MLFFQDLRYLQDDSSRRKASYLTELKSKEEELDAVKALLAKAEEEAEETEQSADDDDMSSPRQSKTRQLEDRLAQLTESLLQKQALLEAVSAEKTSLVLQIERMEVK